MLSFGIALLHLNADASWPLHLGAEILLGYVILYEDPVTGMPGRFRLRGESHASRGRYDGHDHGVTPIHLIGWFNVTDRYNLALSHCKPSRFADDVAYGRHGILLKWKRLDAFHADLILEDGLTGLDGRCRYY